MERGLNKRTLEGKRERKKREKCQRERVSELRFGTLTIRKCPLAIASSGIDTQLDDIYYHSKSFPLLAWENGGENFAAE